MTVRCGSHRMPCPLFLLSHIASPGELSSAPSATWAAGGAIFVPLEQFLRCWLRGNPWQAWLKTPRLQEWRPREEFQTVHFQSPQGFPWEPVPHCPPLGNVLPQVYSPEVTSARHLACQLGPQRRPSGCLLPPRSGPWVYLCTDRQRPSGVLPCSAKPRPPAFSA